MSLTLRARRDLDDAGAFAQWIGIEERLQRGAHLGCGTAVYVKRGFGRPCQWLWTLPIPVNSRLNSL